MATALSSTILYLEQVKQEFCNRHAHLPEQERQSLWLQLVSGLPGDTPYTGPSLANQIPRSLSSSSDMTQQTISNFGAMAPNPAVPMSSPMTRSISACSNNDLQRSSSNDSSWSSFEESQGSYALFSSSAPMQRQPALQPIAEAPFANGATVEYTPAEYCNTYMSSSGSSPMPIPHAQPHNPPQLQLTPSAQWSPSFDYSTSPSTPSTALMTPVTQASNSMSRQGSYNPHFIDQTSMLRVQSDSSSLYPILPEDNSFSFDVESKNNSAPADIPFLSAFTGSSSEGDFLSHVPVSSASADALASSANDNPDFNMMRSSSSASESDSSSASALSINSRQARREREINLQANRCKIAPRTDPNGETLPAASNVSMVRVLSKDGSSKQVGVIARTPYVRPQHPKIMCPHCNKQPEGFRGTHELDRHIMRTHNLIRKGFICVDASEDKKFLANCKHCRNKKVYGAYYNAAAHLRRAHFHPRKRGRKGKSDEKRGGIGGGDHPPMDHLKQFWIREVEVKNTNSTAPSPNSDSDNADMADMSGFDAQQQELDAYTALTQQPNDMFVSMDTTTQYVDLSMCMPETGALYSQSAVAFSATDSEATLSSIDDFQFDACSGRTY